MRYARTAVLFLLAVNMVCGHLVAQPQAIEKIPIATEVKKGTLPNGLTYYIRKNPRPEKKVELRLVLKVGSILESDDQLGLAHFTEHMAFNGSKHFKKNELISFLQSIGVEFGADLNAETSFDETIYILPIPTDKPENLEKGLLALEDWASQLSFEPAEIDKERGIVLEESRLGKGAADRMNKVIYPKIFEGSTYADRLPIGQEEILKTFKPEVIKKFYQDWYRPNLMAVIAVGDLDVAQVEALVKKHFGHLKNPSHEKPRAYATLPTRKISEGLVVTDPEATNHVIQIYYPYQLAKPMTTVQDYRRSMVRAIFNSMLNQRLQELAQKPEPPFLYGSSSWSGFVKNYELYSSVGVVGKGGVEVAIQALLEENERARRFGFTASELERVKANYSRQLERGFNERDKTESGTHANEMIRNFLEDEPIPGIENEFKYFKDFAPTITLEELNSFAAANIPTQAARLIILSGPTQANFNMPTGPELLAIADRAISNSVTPYEEKVLGSKLMETIPAPVSILEEKTEPALGVTELLFANGVRVILKPTDFKNDQVILNATRLGGQSVFAASDKYNAAYATAVVSQMGVSNFTPLDLRKMLAGKSVSVMPRMNLYTEGVSGQCGSADVETMLQMVNLYFTHPRKDDGLFASFISKQQAAVQNIMSNPQAVYQDSLQRILYSNHPRGPRLPRADDFNNVSLDRALTVYESRFGNARGFTFCMVGNFDLSKVKALAATYLGTLPAAKAPASFQDLGIRPVRGVVKKEVKKGTEEKSFVTMVFSGPASYSSKENLAMQALVEVLNIKLIETLREEMSGVYGAGMKGQINKYPYGHYLVTATFPCGPENVDRLTQATLAEIAKLKEQGPTETDLNKVKETWVKQYREELKDNSYWVSRLLQSYEGGTDPGEILTVETRIQALTTKEVQEATKKYLDTENLLEVILNPEK